MSSVCKSGAGSAASFTADAVAAGGGGGAGRGGSFAELVGVAAGAAAGCGGGAGGGGSCAELVGVAAGAGAAASLTAGAAGGGGSWSGDTGKKNVGGGTSGAFLFRHGASLQGGMSGSGGGSLGSGLFGAAAGAEDGFATAFGALTFLFAASPAPAEAFTSFCAPLSAAPAHRSSKDLDPNSDKKASMMVLLIILSLAYSCSV